MLLPRFFGSRKRPSHCKIRNQTWTRTLQIKRIVIKLSGMGHSGERNSALKRRKTMSVVKVWSSLTLLASVFKRFSWRMNSEQAEWLTLVLFLHVTVNTYIGSEMNFHFIWYLWNKLCVFMSPSLWWGDIKHITSFINTYEMKIHVRFFLSHC